MNYSENRNPFTAPQLLTNILDRITEAALYWKAVRDENREIFGFTLGYINNRSRSMLRYFVGSRLIPGHTPEIDWDFLNMLTEVVTTGISRSGFREYPGKNGTLLLHEKVWKEDDGVLILLEKPAHDYDHPLDLQEAVEHEAPAGAGRLPKAAGSTKATAGTAQGLKTRDDYYLALEDQVRQRTAELEHTKNLLQGTLDSAIDMIQVFEAVRNDDGKIVDFIWVLNNNTSAKMYGDVIGKSLIGNNPGIIEEGIFQSFTEVTETGVPQQYEKHYAHENFDGWYFQSVVKLNDGVATTTAVITERKRAEQLLHERNLSLTQAQALGSIGDFYFDCINNTVTWSAELYRIMNVPEDEALTFESTISYYSPADRERLTEAALSALESGEGFEMEAGFTPRETTETRYIFLRAEITKDARGGSIGIKGVVQDITQRKEAEQQILQLNRSLTEKNRELESVNSELKTFNTIAAQDYNEALRAVYLHLENIIKNEAAKMSDSGKASVRKAQATINKMKLLTDDIVAYSRLPQMDNTLVKVSLDAVFKTALQSLDEKLRESCAVAESAELPAIEGYPLLLSLLFQHVLDNAVKFRHPDRSPKITVDAAMVTRQGIPYHQITITDNGIGFDNSEAENIFSIFYRLHERNQYRGSGIGLAVCKKIMALHGGSISAEGRPGTGTSVHCLFPADA